VAIDLHRACRLNPAVTLRPESFGALAHHFGNRRLRFLKSRQLVTVVRLLDHHGRRPSRVVTLGMPAVGIPAKPCDSSPLVVTS
jgi:putative mycofactocin binding protein MftB